MASWPVQDAKARFSKLLATCLKDGPQIEVDPVFETSGLIGRWLAPSC